MSTVARLSQRQRQILGLMGVDLWRLRDAGTTDNASQDTCSDSGSKRPGSAYPGMGLSSNGQSADTGRVLIASNAIASDWLFVCQLDEGQLVTEEPTGMLLDALLIALGLGPQQAALALSVGVEDADKAMVVDWQQLLLEVEPKQVVILGHAVASQLRVEEGPGALESHRKINFADSHARLIISHSLAEMLTRPLLKAELWQELCAAGVTGR